MTTEIGRLLIHEEAVACLAAIAALRCNGVAGMAARGLQDGLADILGRDNPGRGVDVDLDDDRCTVALDLIVAYGAQIRAVADDVVRGVRTVVEATTGIPVDHVEVRVQGVRPPGAVVVHPS